ncbi:MucR family transcriptional regulator [Methylobacterium sp. NEAU 140]|uniref:MucR family transcriptional regulator n=1 Tax=Methylobacterium sp. NEAU 140 TaxID=3064945 RepID=UPI0027361B5C|nr:MucR family transcriptional regulator [Methylobacterium sp. NEAU 140]MDP4023133.1 MucR family transcriptional regulator [Methylobacterium sp. NEAU 140]
MDGNTKPAAGHRADCAVRIVCAYVASNRVQAPELPSLLANVHASLAGLTARPAAEPGTAARATPTQVRRSITPDHLVSFEDGKPYKTLRRHLTLRGLTPEAYREKWGLPRDYPMTAAAYSAQRSELARSLGLGLRHREPAAIVEPAGSKPPAARRGR